MIDAYASAAHYVDHLRPIFDALPDGLRGTFWCPSDRTWGAPIGLERRDPGRLVLVAGWIDAQAMAPSPLIYVEHGAGQSYDGDPRSASNGSYAGGDDLERVELFIAPGEHVAARWIARYPSVRVAVVGCPKLDRWHDPARYSARTRDNPKPSVSGFASRNEGAESGNPTVAVTFHWDCRLIPETTTAWRDYDRVLPQLVTDPRWSVLGHGHPRLYRTIAQRWEQLHTPHTGSFDEILEHADLLVGDNTSALYEFASTGRPVLCVNASVYRRDIDHGLRFWSYPPGLEVDHPHQLIDGVARALADPPEARAIRHAAVAHVYAHTDGSATRRTVQAIKELTDV